MLQNWKWVIAKLLFIILIIILFYKLSNGSLMNRNMYENWSNTQKLEHFADAIEMQKINYIKLNETYIDDSDSNNTDKTASLKLLYANYSGEEVDATVWQNKTLNQCTDICNQLEGCSGFSRNLVLDNEPANCYPHNKIAKCYSNRKGDSQQMQRAINYNSFIKSNVPNILNKCIGDTELTLNRIIYIKSYANPNTYLGVNTGDGRVSMIDMNAQNFNTLCNFRIEQGQDGVGTVSFLHIASTKYLYRDTSSNLTLKDINTNSSTQDKQRVSFNIYDSLNNSDAIMLKSMTISGETTDKFITINNTGKYLGISIVDSTTDSNAIQNSIFYITDSIINSNIITNKSNMPMSTQAMNSNMNMNSNMQQKSIPSRQPNQPIQVLPSVDNLITTTTMYNDNDNDNPNSSSIVQNKSITSGQSNQSVQALPSIDNLLPITTLPNTNTNNNNNNNKTNNKSNNKSNSNSKMNLPSKIPKITMNEVPTIENFSVNLDTSSSTPVYYNLFQTPSNVNLQDYVQDTYMTSQTNTPAFMSISNKINNIVISKELSTSLTKNEDEYNTIYELNKELEREINNLNLGLNAKNDKISNGLDRMRLTDMSNDYFFLKNISR